VEQHTQLSSVDDHECGPLPPKARGLARAALARGGRVRPPVAAVLCAFYIKARVAGEAKAAIRRWAYVLSGTCRRASPLPPA